MLKYKFQYDFGQYPPYDYEVSQTQLIDALYHILFNNTNIFDEVKKRSYYKNNQFSDLLVYETICALFRSLDDVTFDNIVSDYWDELTDYFREDAKEEYESE